jgi:hypothetical protein
MASSKFPSTIIAMWLKLQNGEHSAFAKTQLYRYYITEHPRTPDIDGGVPYIVVGCTVKAITLIKV